MAGALHQLNARQIEAAKPGACLHDGQGLFLRVTQSGAARWSLRYTHPGTGARKEMGLGTARQGGMTLREARDKAAEVRALIRAGVDPMQQAKDDEAAAAAERARRAEASTFGAYIQNEFLPARLKRFTNPKHCSQWEASFVRDAAALMPMKLENITRADVLAVLRPIWDTKHVTAQRVRGRLEAAFDAAIQNGLYHGDNPARWSLFNATLSKPRKMEGRGHMAALPGKDLPQFIQRLRAAQKDSLAALALEFVILAACRSGEARLARWQEFDTDAALWRIPSERLKVKRRGGAPYVHTVPLTPRMVAILETLRAADPGAGPGDFLFPGQPTKRAKLDALDARGRPPLSDMTLSAVLRRMKLDVTVHGFRSTFRDWTADETEFAAELAEEQLCHVLPAVQRAYRRGEALARRRAMMEAWEAFSEGRGNSLAASNVVPMRASAGGREE